ncbi:MAG: DUF4349 domain-containing protein [Calothrix sp. SM1_7_51]|nr:DUF4349 domain-containing protein [Calothrix sp. SM1_7_51]
MNQVSSSAIPASTSAQKLAPPQDASQEKSATEQQTATRQRPQLIKKAAMTVIVDSVDKSVDAVSKIVAQKQGDVIKLEQKQAKDDDARQTATIQLRVPQNSLEITLNELAKLGKVESRNISAQDVGDQLVDFQARLGNLRKTEANLQKIMDRAGSIKDVLNVSNELSNIRESIEQIDAQLKSLQNQVSYSTITINLEAVLADNKQGRDFGSQIQQTWSNSTHSVGSFTTGLLNLCIWLMVYSPYLLVITASIYGFNHWRSSHQPVAPTRPGDSE